MNITELLNLIQQIESGKVIKIINEAVEQVGELHNSIFSGNIGTIKIIFLFVIILMSGKKEGIPDIKLNSDGINELFTTAYDVLKEDISEIVKNKVLEIKKISEKYMEITDRKPEIIENLKSKIKKGREHKETVDIFELYRLVKNLKIVPDILLPYIMYSYVSCFGNEEQIKYFRVMRTPELLEKSVNNIEILKSITENKEMLKFDEAGEMRNMYSIKETVNKTVENYLGFSPIISKYNIEKFITENMDFNI